MEYILLSNNIVTGFNIIRSPLGTRYILLLHEGQFHVTEQDHLVKVAIICIIFYVFINIGNFACESRCNNNIIQAKIVSL